jgi:response regulator RpfG family c-di-GMP phosphodiesterase
VADDVEIAGLLHDVAKIGYPRKLLAYQAGFWNSEDAERYHRHAAEGQQAVQLISRLERVGDFIRAHHERFDGQGFPDRLSEDNIPVGGRIIAVANAYDRIVHLDDNTQLRVREYTKAVKGAAGRPAEELRREAARHYLKQRAFTRFDPDVVKCFLGLREAGASPVEDVKEISMTELRPGMRLARDLYATSGSFLLSQGTVISVSHVVKLKLLRAKSLCADTLAVSPPAPPLPEGTNP